MSGIFGLWRLDGHIALEACHEMSRTLEHRGPDGSSSWNHGGVSLGHHMLHTTPESEREFQPLVTAEGDFVLTADARIDNRAELIAALGVPGAGREGITDADLILASYRSWGQRCAEHWIGDFAVAIWDSRRSRFFCARDPFGVKPFYYHHTPGRLFAFASEVDALLALEDVDDEIDEPEIARHLLIPLGRDNSTTYFRHVRRLMPAHVLVISEREFEVRRYWELDPTKELRLANDGEYTEALRETFVEAVRCRLRSATPVASMLSGGIDSASITCVAAELLADVPAAPALHALSAVYPSVPDSDERKFIEHVLEKYRMVPHFFAADLVSPIADIDRMNQLIGGAGWGANLYLNWVLYGVAAEAGARVVLDGFDGDTTLSHGTGYLSELAMKGRWLKLARTSLPYSRLQGRPALSDYLRMIRLGLGHRSRDSVTGNLFRRFRTGTKGKTRPHREPTNRHFLLNTEFANQFSDRVVVEQNPPMIEREFHWRKLNGLALFEGVSWLEACAAGRGVEVRLPFCDVRLAELCLSFPPDQKIRGGWTRYAMRRAMEGILPPGIQWRMGKADLNPGWASAWRSTQNGRIEAMFRHPSPAIRRYLEPARILELHARYIAGKAEKDESLALWRALSLALWLSSRNV